MSSHSNDELLSDSSDDWDPVIDSGLSYFRPALDLYCHERIDLNAPLQDVDEESVLKAGLKLVEAEVRLIRRAVDSLSQDVDRLFGTLVLPCPGCQRT